MIIKTFFILLSVPLAIIILAYLLSQTNIFSSNEFSNQIKIGHIESFMENINVKNFLIGDGLGSYYFSKGVNGMLAHTEITPMDMLRYLGFILTPFLYCAILFPSKVIRNYLDNKVYFLLFILYLIASLTNPIMFNSFGLLIVLWYWQKIINSTNTKETTVCKPFSQIQK
jgi:hypothetical protein